MSDKHQNNNVVVDQNEALDFYFDSLLLSEENDGLLGDNSTQASHSIIPDAQQKDSNDSLDSATVEPQDQLQLEKDFLQASKQRQQNNKISQLTNHNVSPVFESATLDPAINKEVVVNVVETISTKAAERLPPESDKPKKDGTISFANKASDGQITEQILIPRSQRLASQNKKAQDTIVVSQNERLDNPTQELSQKSVNHSSAPETKPLMRSDAETEKHTRVITQEAPNLDLSLFLPKIKTLSDDEIAQQIEALTQAAVDQAQLESELAHSAQLLQASQNRNERILEENGPIRNISNAPPWAVPNFQALLFTVAGLKLAVPLFELNGIVEWGDEYINELPGHKPWYLGIIQNQGKNIPVVDTLQQVVPENRWPDHYLQEKKFKHIILIDNSRWGLACETVLEVITLKTDAVKWRSSRTKRRWLLGTVIEPMCALLDSSEFSAMLKTGEDSLLN